MTDSVLRLESETVAEHAAFLAWLAQDPRPIPHASQTSLARKHNWAGRAQAALTVPGSDPGAVVRQLTDIAKREVAKLHREVSESAGSVLPPREIRALITLLADLQERGEAAGRSASAGIDYTKFTTEELRVLQEAERLKRERLG